MKIYNRLLGNGWIYDRVRPWFLGGFDFTEVYSWLGETRGDILIDVGCGTGYALKHIKVFRSYHGFDVDSHALSVHKAKYPDEKIFLQQKKVAVSDVISIKPTKGIVMGLLHHLSDTEAHELFNTLHSSGTLESIITLDTVYLSKRWGNNLLAFFDRGRFVRDEMSYKKIISQSPYTIKHQKLVNSGNHLASYFATCLAVKKNVS